MTNSTVRAALEDIIAAVEPRCRGTLGAIRKRAKEALAALPAPDTNEREALEHITELLADTWATAMEGDPEEQLAIIQARNALTQPADTKVSEALSSLIEFAAEEAKGKFEDYAGYGDVYEEPSPIAEAREALVIPQGAVEPKLTEPLQGCPWCGGKNGEHAWICRSPPQPASNASAPTSPARDPVTVEAIAAAVHEGRFPDGKDAINYCSFEDECDSGKEYCRRIARQVRALLAAPAPSEPITTEQLDQLQFGRSLHERPPAPSGETVEQIVQRIKEACAEVADRFAANVAPPEGSMKPPEHTYRLACDIAKAIRTLIPAAHPTENAEAVAWQWRYVGETEWKTPTGGRKLSLDDIKSERPIEQRALGVITTPTSGNAEAVAWLRVFDRDGEEVTELCDRTERGAFAIYRATPTSAQEADRGTADGGSK